MPAFAPCELNGAAVWESAHALIISDLHLSPQSPVALRAFYHLLAAHAPRYDSLLILGDLFEVYAGDDALQRDAFTAQVAQQLSLAARHCRIAVMHGNRDFLIGSDFCAAANVRLLADPCVLSAPANALAGAFENALFTQSEPLLLSHGDAWCVLDTAYQTKKLEIRSPQWQNQVLALPWAQRWALAHSYREQSMAQRASAATQSPAHLDRSVYDVVLSAFAASCALHGVKRGLHGHTHAPAHHAASGSTGANGATGARSVLGDWQFDACAAHGENHALSLAAIVGAWQGGALELLRYDGLDLHSAALSSLQASPALVSSPLVSSSSA